MILHIKSLDFMKCPIGDFRDMVLFKLLNAGAFKESLGEKLKLFGENAELTDLEIMEHLNTKELKRHECRETLDTVFEWEPLT